MKKQNKIVIITTVILGIVLVLIGIVYLLVSPKTQDVTKPIPSIEPTNNSNVIDEKPSPSIKEDEIVIITKEKAIQTIKSIYEVENLIITYKEEANDYYIFEQKNSNNVVFNTFKFNKITGEIIKEENVNTVPNF